MKIIKLSFFFLSLFASTVLVAQSPVGLWKTIDDNTGDVKSHVEVYKKNGKFYGKVVKLTAAATTDICIDCPGDKNGANLIDLDILWDLKPYRDYWSYGKIVDPANGKVYKCSVWLEDNELKVRGYIGFSLIGRTQTWKKI